MNAHPAGPGPPQTCSPERASTGAAPEATFAPDWQRTLFVMLGIQLGMNMGFTVLSPVVPLFLPQLGVRDSAQIDLWPGRYRP